MKLNKVFIVILTLVMSQMCSLAAQLPKNVQDFILKEEPKASIRFDGLITLEDGSIYLPVIPSYLTEVKELAVTYTYPEKASLKKKPEVVILNNNYSFLKLIKTKSGILTVCQNPNLPFLLKTGVIPQDLLVPRGLVLPDTLKGLLGDIQVPLLSTTNIVPNSQVSGIETPLVATATKVVNSNYSGANVSLTPQLKNKLYYVSNNSSPLLKVFSSDSTAPMYSLKFSGVPKVVESAVAGKYLLVISNYNKQLQVIDVKNEYIAKQIDLSVIPSDIVVCDSVNKAFVASVEDKSLFVVDLVDMKIKEKISIVGTPVNLAISVDGSQLAYQDKDSSNIYVIKFNDQYKNQLVANHSNISKMLINNNQLFLLDRVDGKLNILKYDLDRDLDQEQKDEQDRLIQAKKKESLTLGSLIEEISSGIDPVIMGREKLIQGPKYYTTSENQVQVGIRPTDMLLYKGKLFVLCSADAAVYVIDIAQQSIISKIQLPKVGFPRKITMLQNSPVALITNVSAKKYDVIDLDKYTLLQTVNIDSLVSEVAVVDKK